MHHNTHIHKIHTHTQHIQTNTENANKHAILTIGSKSGLLDGPMSLS